MLVSDIMRLSNNDPSSYSTPETEIIHHVDLDWTVDFEKKVVKGTAELHFKILAKSIEQIVSRIELSNGRVLTIYSVVPGCGRVEDFRCVVQVRSRFDTANFRGVQPCAGDRLKVDDSFAHFVVGRVRLLGRLTWISSNYCAFLSYPVA